MSFAAEPSTPPSPPTRRRVWPWVVGVLVLIAAAVTALVYRPFPTDEERKYVGVWYGIEKVDETLARAWIADFRGDASMHILFAQYSREGAKLPWKKSVTEELGSWRVRDGIQILATDSPAHPVSVFERLQRLENTGHWRRVHNYETLEISERKLHYRALPGGPEYHSLRAKGPITFPAEPLPPEEWSAK